MFRNSEFKTQPAKYMQTLRSNINYDNPEIFRGPVKTEIINKSHGSGYLHLKVFKILNPKKGGGQGTSQDSDSVRGVATNQGNKNVRALIDETAKRVDEFGSDELQKRINQMRLALEQVKKGIRHPSAKLKPSNIMTPGNFEAAEIQRYQAEIRQLEAKYKEMKAREENEEQRTRTGNEDEPKPNAKQNDFLLMDMSNVDYEQVKGQYPLSGNQNV